MIHREQLVSKCLPKDMKDVMSQAIQIVNFIKSRPLKSRLFAELCESIKSEYKCLLYHTEVCWLSKGKVLKRLLQLTLEVRNFIKSETDKFDKFINNEIWWTQISFLSNIFDKLNELNLSLQGPDENIITSTSKMTAFREKLILWKSKISDGVFDCYPSVNASNLKQELASIILATLSELHLSLDHNFPSPSIADFDCCH